MALTPKDRFKFNLISQWDTCTYEDIDRWIEEFKQAIIDEILCSN